MKIDLQNLKNYHTPYAENKRQSVPSATAPKLSKNYDAITIHAEQEPAQERLFADALSSRLSMEVRQPVSAAQIQDLQQQIKQGTYQVDINNIVDKIMLY